MEIDEEKEYSALIANYREAWKSKAARIMVWDILSQCGLYSEQMTGNSNTFYLLGKKSIGLFILERLQDMDLKAYAKLILEQQED